MSFLPQKRFCKKNNISSSREFPTLFYFMLGRSKSFLRCQTAIFFCKCVTIYLSVYKWNLYICIYIYIHKFLMKLISIYLYISIYIYIYLYIYISISISISISIYLSLSVSLSLYIYMLRCAIWNRLHNLKKREKHLSRSMNCSKVAGWSVF